MKLASESTLLLPLSRHNLTMCQKGIEYIASLDKAVQMLVYITKGRYHFLNLDNLAYIWGPSIKKSYLLLICNDMLC